MSIKFPTDSRELLEIRQRYRTWTTLDDIVGCVDGTHIPINLPPSTDSRSFYSFKGYYSHLVLAMCDWKFRVIALTSGTPGSCGDSQIVVLANLD